MAQRITSMQSARQFLQDLQVSHSRMAKTQREMATGNRINSVKDDPIGTAKALSIDAQRRSTVRFQRNVDAGIAHATAVDDSLKSVTSALQRMRELLLQASNTTTSQATLDTLAEEAAQLRDSVRGEANAQHAGRYIFAGTATSTEPYPAAAGNPYNGNDLTTLKRIGPGQEMNLTVPGKTVFGETTGALATQLDMFDLMDRIVSDMTTGTPATRAMLGTNDLAAVDAYLQKVSARRASVGGQIRQLDAMKERLSVMEERLAAQHTEIVGADMAKTYLDFQTHQTMYESAITAGSRLLRSGLLDFLK